MNAAAKPRELPEFVDDLIRVGKARLVAELGAADEAAQHVMGKIAADIVNEYARRSMYIPAGFGTRNSEIWKAYGERGPASNGQPGADPYTRARIEELAVQYGLTSRQVYSILGAMRAQELATRQGQLPGMEPAP